MKKLSCVVVFVLVIISCYSQSEEPLLIYKCKVLEDGFIVVSNQPKLKLKKPQLELILNKSLSLPKQKKDSIINLYVKVTIDCDSTAEYEFFQENHVKLDSVLGDELVKILKQNCSWSPGIYNIEHTKNIPKKEKGKIVFKPQYIYWLVKTSIGLKFSVQNGKIAMK